MVSATTWNALGASPGLWDSFHGGSKRSWKLARTFLCIRADSCLLGTYVVERRPVAGHNAAQPLNSSSRSGGVRDRASPTSPRRLEILILDATTRSCTLRLTFASDSKRSLTIARRGRLRSPACLDPSDRTSISGVVRLKPIGSLGWQRAARRSRGRTVLRRGPSWCGQHWDSSSSRS
jgi:hypothetical protein